MTVALRSTGAEPTRYPPVDQLPARAELPDPLTFLDGKKVATKEDWARRRVELKDLFQHYMYGYLPAPAPIEARVTKTADILGGKGTLKEVEIRFPTLGDKAPRMHLAIFLPKGVAKAPLFLSLNSCGNIEALDDPAITDHAEVWRRENCKSGQRGTAIAVIFRVVRFERYGPVVGGDGRIALPQPGQRKPAMIVRFGVIGFQRHGAIEMRQRFGQAPLFLQDKTQIVLQRGIAGLKQAGAAQIIGGMREVAHLRSDHPQQLQGIKVRRLTRQHLFIDRPRFGQPSFGSGRLRLAIDIRSIASVFAAAAITRRCTIEE